jgi:hypothetical protein
VTGVARLRRRRRIVAIAAAAATAGVVAAVILATTGSSHARTTRAQYLAAVAAVCRIYGPRLDRIRPPDVAEPANVIVAVDRVLPLVNAQLRRVEALEPPDALRAKVSRWLTLQQRRLRILEKAQAAGRRQDFRTMSVAYVDFLLAGRETGGLGKAIGIPHPPC